MRRAIAAGGLILAGYLLVWAGLDLWLWNPDDELRPKCHTETLEGGDNGETHDDG